MRIRSYTELLHLKTFEERYNYLKLSSGVGRSTFGFDRYLNQMLYKSKKWLDIRRDIIVRDDGCDLGIRDYVITSEITVHHMNPISPEMIELSDDKIFDPEFLISTSRLTHLAIHYGDESLLIKIPTVRRPGDTIPWR